MNEYKAENYIEFIESGRFDKISHYGMELIAEEFRKQQEQIKEFEKENKK